MAVDIVNLIGSLIVTILVIPLSAFFLKITAKMFKLSDRSYGTAFKVSLIVLLVSFIYTTISNTIGYSTTLTWIMGLLFLIIVAIFNVWVIKKNYNLEWGKSSWVLLVWGIITIVVAFILAIIFSILALLIGIKLFFGV